MTGRWVVLAAMALALAPRESRGVGLEGPDEASHRLDARLGVGWDTVGGLGTSSYGYGDMTARFDARHRRLAIGVLGAVRYDAVSFDHALDRWTERRGPGVAVQLTAGYDGPSFHLSAGPWIYGERRDNPHFRYAVLPTVLPFGVIRLRVGSLEESHTTFALSDGAPFTVQGGAAFRLVEGLPPYDSTTFFMPARVRLSAGAYYNLWEQTGGVLMTRESQWNKTAQRSFIYGLSFGTQLSSQKMWRLEAGAFLGFACW